MNANGIWSSLHRGLMLAAAVPGTRESTLAWVGVYPLDLSSPLSRELLANQRVRVPSEAVHVYHVRCFEVARTLVEAEVWIAEPQLERTRSVFALSDAQLVSSLEQLGVSLEMLRIPVDVDYPL